MSIFKLEIKNTETKYKQKYNLYIITLACPVCFYVKGEKNFIKFVNSSNFNFKILWANYLILWKFYLLVYLHQDK